jgi:hypothetical protein
MESLDNYNSSAETRNSQYESQPETLAPTDCFAARVPPETAFLRGISTVRFSESASTLQQ